MRCWHAVCCMWRDCLAALAAVAHNSSAARFPADEARPQALGTVCDRSAASYSIRKPTRRMRRPWSGPRAMADTAGCLSRAPTPRWPTRTSPSRTPAGLCRSLRLQPERRPCRRPWPTPPTAWRGWTPSWPTRTSRSRTPTRCGRSSAPLRATCAGSTPPTARATAGSPTGSWRWRVRPPPRLPPGRPQAGLSSLPLQQAGTSSVGRQWASATLLP